MLKVSQDNYGAMKDLIAEGATSLVELRQKFKDKTGRDTTLDDDKLTAAAAAQTDDDDDELVALITQVEAQGYELAA